MNVDVLIGLVAIALPMVLALVIASLAERQTERAAAFRRLLDVLIPPATPRGRL